MPSARKAAATAKAAVKRHVVHATVGQADAQGMPVLKAGLAAQHRDSRGACQDAFVLGVAQFIDTPLLLGE